MKKSSLICVGVLVAVLWGWWFWTVGQVSHILPAGGVKAVVPVEWILDPGHGGEDGGAVSPSGTVESQLNLAVAQKLDALLAFYGKSTYLLREGDYSLHNSSAQTLKEKKRSDLQTRVHRVNGYPDATLISIHQNMFSKSQYAGTQVFYSPTPGSQQLAEKLQEAVRTQLQPVNQRESKKIPENVYLMNHVKPRAVLVECGFLSNPEEEQQLCDPIYQRKLVSVLASVLLSDVEHREGSLLLSSDLIQ